MGIDPVSLGIMGVSAATNLIGGFSGSSAAKDAAKKQQEAAINSGNLLFNAANSVNPNINSQAQQAAAWAIDNAKNAGADVRGAASSANDMLSPYRDAGQQGITTLADLLKPGGDLTRQFTGADMEAYDPGYQFRIEQGQKALERSQASRGGYNSGGTLKALTRYSQGTASDEFQNAFGRFMAGRQQTYGMLSGLADRGQAAAGQSGANLIGAERYAGDANINAGQFGGGLMYDAAGRTGANTMQAAQGAANALTGAGNAAAAGSVGSANAWGGALGGVSNLAQLMLLLRQNTPGGGAATSSGGGGGWSNSGWNSPTFGGG